MTVQYGIVLYTFSPEEETEIALEEGEQVLIYNEELGEGWSEGENSKGQRGLFPRNYVNITGIYEGKVKNESPKMDDTSNQLYDLAPSDSASDYNPDKKLKSSLSSPVHENLETGNSTTPEINRSLSESENNNFDTPLNTFLSRYYNRFTFFVKSQAEDYILGTLPNIQSLNNSDSSNLKISIYKTEGPIWAPEDDKFNLKVTTWGKSDPKGLLSSSYLYFEVETEPKICQEIVKRRYEHFTWLVEQMSKKYPSLLIPVLPQKCIVEEAALHRQIKLLNIWCRQISNNPVLQQSDLIKMFCSLTDQKEFRKSRRAAEADKQVLGASFKLATINKDSMICTVNKADTELARARRLHDCVSQQFNLLVNSSLQTADAYQKSLSPALNNTIKAYQSLGDQLIEHRTFGTNELGQAFQASATILNDINTKIVTQPRNAYTDVSDNLWVHRRKLDSWPGLFNINELSITKHKDAENMQEKVKGKPEQHATWEPIIQLVKNRTDRVLTITQAEINHHTKEIVMDTKLTMQKYLQRQIDMHKELVEKYQTALDAFNNVPEV